MNMKVINETHEIWNAIDKGGGDTINVINELDKAGYYIIDKGTLKTMYVNYDFDMKGEYTWDKKSA